MILPLRVKGDHLLLTTGNFEKTGRGKVVWKRSGNFSSSRKGHINMREQLISVFWTMAENYIHRTAQIND